MEDPQDYGWWTESCDKTTAQTQIDQYENMEERENSIQIKTPVNTLIKYNRQPRLPAGMTKLNMDYDQFLHKPLFVKSFDWTTTTPIGLLSAGTTSIPGEIFSRNNFLAVPWKTSCFYRMSARTIVQTAGTIKHGGVLLAAVVPATYQRTTLNGMLGVPHGFLYPNQSNAVSIEIPFYNESPLRQTNQSSKAPRLVGINDQYDSYADIDFYVINQLTAGSSVTSTVTVTIHIIIDQLEFYVPSAMDIVYPQSVVTQLFDGTASVLKKGSSDLIDKARSTLRQWTGLHNPNLGAPVQKSYMQHRTNPNVIDSVVPYDLLGPYTAYDTSVQDYIFKTDKDEMDVSYLLGIPQFIGRVQVLSTAVRGDHLFSRPITPFMNSGQNSASNLNTIQSKLAYCASHWKGSMQLMIQSSMSNVQFFKLLVVLDYTRNYNATTLGSNTVPSMDSFHGTLTHTLEFNGGGSIQCVDLPFFSAYRQLPCNTDWLSNALQHGMVRVYLLQPLVSGDSTLSNPSINFYIKCKDDFSLLGFANRRVTDLFVTASPTLLSSEIEESIDQLDVQSYQGEMAALVTTTDQDCITDQHQAGSDQDNFGGLRPIKHLRDIMRRLYPAARQNISSAIIANEPSRSISVLVNVHDLMRPVAGERSPVSMLLEQFYGFRGGLRFKIMITGANLSTVSYMPPNMGVPGVPVTSFGTAVRYVPTSDVTSDTDINNYNKFSLLPYATKPIKNFPLQEQANFFKRNLNRNYRSGTEYAISDSLNVHDIEIPYMSHLDFTTSIQAYTTNPTQFASYSDNMGALEIAFTPTIVSPDNVPIVYSDVFITYFVGLADDARVGMLVPTKHYNPDFILPTSTTRSQTDAIMPAYNLSSAQPNYVRLEINNSGALPCYTG